MSPLTKEEWKVSESLESLQSVRIMMGQGS